MRLRRRKQRLASRLVEALPSETASRETVPPPIPVSMASLD
jgi:hypothetical protein